MILILLLFLLGFINIFNHLEIFIKQYYNAKRTFLYWKQRLISIKCDRLLIYRFTLLILSLWFLLISFKAFLYCLFLGSLIITSSQVKKFSPTRRSVSLYVFSILVTFFICLMVKLIDNSLIWLLVYILINLPFLLITISNFILIPYEKSFQLFYLKQAKKKLKENPNLKIIGITGSYGKTSFKNYLYALLSQKYNVIKTPGSINTKMGICKFINKSLSPYDDFFIVEFGVDEIKGMDKLLTLVKPHIAIITSIGEMHLATFKSIENIKKEKLKLAKAAKDKVVFYNCDSLMNSNDFTSLSSFPYSIKDAKKINVDINGTTCVYKGQDISVSLYGNLHLSNLIGSIEVAKYLSLSNSEINSGLSKIKQVKHRLSLEKRGKFYVLDDSYNGNKLGILEAIKVLKSFKGKKAIITPGVIELGDKYQETNMEIGKALVGIDLIYIIGDETHPMYEGYIKMNGDINRVNFYDSFLLSYHQLLKENINVLLIANDRSKDYLR